MTTNNEYQTVKLYRARWMMSSQPNSSRAAYVLDLENNPLGIVAHRAHRHGTQYDGYLPFDLETVFCCGETASACADALADEAERLSAVWQSATFDADGVLASLVDSAEFVTEMTTKDEGPNLIDLTVALDGWEMAEDLAGMVTSLDAHLASGGSLPQRWAVNR